MQKHTNRSSGEFPYLDTPAGIVTPKGHIFRTTEALLQKHAGALFEIQPLHKMLKRATQWIESTDGIGIAAMLVCLLLLPAVPAVLAALAIATAWHVYKSAFAGPGLQPVAVVFGYDIFQLVIALGPLSFFGMEGAYTKLIAGIVLFIVFKFGWVRKIIDKLLNRNADPAKPGSNDRLLHMLLTRYSLREGITPPHLQKMEADISEAVRKSREQQQTWTRKRTSKKQKR